MRKRLKKLTAVVLTAGMFASSLFVNGVTAKAEETTVLKKGTVIYDFKEITDVKELEPGVQYFFSTKQFGAEDAVASLPAGSAILQFAGTNIEKAIEAGTFAIRYETYESYRNTIMKMIRSGYLLTEEEIYNYYAMDYGFSSVPTSWDELIQMQKEVSGYSDLEERYGAGATGLNKFLAERNEYYEEELQYFIEQFPEDEEKFLSDNGFDSWEDVSDKLLENQQGSISELVECFESSCGQYHRDGYVAVVQAGTGFDTCEYGTIAYLEELIMPSAETGDENSENSQAGWYYACAYGGVSYVGPFHAYSYKVGEFIEDDLIITFAEDWQTPTAATTVTKDDLALSVVIDGEEIFIPFYALTDASVDPENNDTTITLTVGDIVKEVEVCNIEPGEIDKDVQIEEGAPTVGLEDAVDALKETVLTEAEHKLVESGVNIDIFMTVAGKDEEELGEDKAVLEEALDEDDKAVYLDLKLFKKVGNNEPTAISDVPGGKIKVSIEVPDSIKAFAANAKVVRVHGTEVTELATTYDATTNKLTFETDKFSTYAIVYNDSDNTDNSGEGNNPDDGNNSGEGNKPDDGGQGSEAPDTGDSSMVMLYLAVVAMSGAVVIKRKKISEM